MTSLPGSAVPHQLGPYDKVVHFTVYAVFAVLLTRDLSEITGRWRAAIFAIVIAAAFAAADEWHQGFIPGRATELADWQADSIGAAGGAFVFAFVSRRRATRTSTNT